MPQIEISIPEDTYVQFEQLADEEFISEEQAFEQLIAAGLDAYGVPDTDEPREGFADEAEENLWDVDDTTGV